MRRRASPRARAGPAGERRAVEQRCGRPTAACRPAMQRAIVVLPLPDSPTSATRLAAARRERDVARGDDVAVRACGARPWSASTCEQRRGRRGRDGRDPRAARARPRWRSPPLEAAHARAPAAISSSGGSASSQASTPLRAARRERAARRPLADTDGDAARSRAAGAAPRGRESRRRGRACTGGAAGRSTAAVGPCLDDAAGVHHGDAVGDGRRPPRGRARRRRSPRRVSRRSRRISSRMRAWVTTSRPVVGSSSTTSGGPQTSAMAIATRCCWPPESWWG